MSTSCRRARKYSSITDAPDNSIDPGELGRVIFIRSDVSPGKVNGYVNSGLATAKGLVVGTVPEPSIISLLVTGGLVTVVGAIVGQRCQKHT